MAEHQKFHYKNLESFVEEIESLHLQLPISKDLAILKKPIPVGNKMIPNAMAIQPMEGADGTLDGKPGELTFRRYKRFAKGGAGLIWIEATAVVPEGKANPRHLYLSKENKEEFQRLLEVIHTAAKEKFGPSHRPYTVIQLTHAGRYSKPEGVPKPVIVNHNPYLDRNIPEDYPIISDAELEQLEDQFVEAAKLAKEIGFDAVDVKGVHRYLLSDLLSAFTREGKYGGSFENRTRFLLNIINKIKDILGDSIEVTTRINAYDAIPYPYGWGVNQKDAHVPDLEEPIRLVQILRERGMKLIDISTGNPYYNPHVGRPYDLGGYVPPQHPLEGCAKMLHIIKEIQGSVPDMTVISTGYSWLREFGANVAAGGIQEGWFTMMGVGRQGFAYPDFARDIVEQGGMVHNKCCITCSNCTEIMRYGGSTGCVVKDPQVYASIYKQCREGKSSLKGTHIAEHV